MHLFGCAETNVVWQELGWDSGEDFLKQQSSSVFELELGSTAEPRRSKRASRRSSSSIGIEMSLLGAGAGAGAGGAASDAVAAAPEGVATASAEGAWGGMSIEGGGASDLAVASFPNSSSSGADGQRFEAMEMVEGKPEPKPEPEPEFVVDAV